MKEARIQIDQQGRFLLPAKVRKEFNIKSGEVFILKKIGKEMKLTSLDKAVENAQNLIHKHVPKGVSLVKELFKSRREEFTLEEKKFNKKLR